MGERGMGRLRRDGDPVRELDAELAEHIRRRAEELERDGVPNGDAFRRAREEFGDLEGTRRYCRRQDRMRLAKGRIRRLLTTLRDDAWAALRGMGRRPRSVLVPAAILATAVTLNALVFSVVRSVLLAPLPFQDPDRVYVVEEVQEGGGLVRAAYPVLDAWRRDATTADAVAGYLDGEFTLVTAGRGRSVPGVLVTAGFFGLIDRPFRVGRGFREEDHRIGASRTVVISEGLWQRLFGGDPAILDRALRLRGEPHRVVGVVQNRAAFPDGAQLWLPLEPSVPDLLDVAGAKILVGLARLRPGADPASAERELTALSAGVPGGAPAAAAVPVADRVLGDVRAPLLLLQGAVLLVLLAACANAGGLLLARAARRRGALAVRASLGAGAVRLARALLLEGLLLGVGAGLLGLALAMVLLRPALAMVPSAIPRAGEVALDPTVVAVCLGLAAVTGVAAALAPALAGARTAPAILLREATGSTGGTPWLRRILGGLVVGQVALAMMLTAGAGLLLRSFVSTVTEDPGFDPSRVTVLDVSLPEYRYPDPASRTAFARELLDRAADLPGAEVAALGRNLPISGSNMTSPLVVEGSESPTEAVQIASVTGTYFEVLGIPLLDGAGFGAADREGGPPVLVVGGTVRTPEGRPLTVGDRAHSFFGSQEMRDVVGIAGPVRHGGLREAPGPVVYEPFFQRGGFPGFSLLVRSGAPPATVAAAARALVLDLDPELPVDHVATMASRIGDSVAEARFYTVGLSVFGGLALLLALAGCQAALAHRVEARQRELGLRMALGASARGVRGVVVRQGAVLTAAGALAGLVAALPAGRVLESQLYGVTPTDPLTWVGAAILLVGAGALASDLPARRAASVDPAETLREG